jgi:hypothetical protein
MRFMKNSSDELIATAEAQRRKPRFLSYSNGIARQFAEKLEILHEREGHEFHSCR